MSHPVGGWRAPLAGWVTLQALMAVRYPWEAQGFAGSLLRLCPDLLILAAAVFALRGRYAGGWLAHLLVLGALLVPLYRFGVSVMPAFYDKPFDLHNDMLRAPGLVHLLLHEYSATVQMLCWVAALVAVLAFYLLVWWLVRPVLRVRRPLRVVQVCVVLGVVFAGVRALGGGAAERLLADSMYAEVVKGGQSIVDGWHLEEEFARRVEEARAAMEGVPTNLARLEGADVVVAFVESYGRALFREPGSAERFAEQAAGWRAELEADGFHVLSAFTFPAIRGGGSHLAHAQFMSGVKIEKDRLFEMLLDSPLQALGKYFQAAGYRTYNVQPAMPIEWPRGKFFGFTHDLFESAFDHYGGHLYPWGRVPDQFALAVLRQEMLAGESPVFAQYISVTSHSPYSHIPPYYEDWSRAGTPGAFHEAPVKQYDIHWLNYVGHPQVEEAYLDSICYSVRTLSGFVRSIPRRCLLVILGDHQAPVVGELMEADGSYDVPVHVLSSDPALLFPFYQSGFHEGFVPPADADSFPTTVFHGRLLTLFSTPDEESASGPR